MLNAKRNGTVTKLKPYISMEKTRIVENAST